MTVAEQGDSKGISTVFDTVGSIMGSFTSLTMCGDYIYIYNEHIEG